MRVFSSTELSQNTSEEMVLAVVGSKSDLYYALPPDQRQTHVPKAAQEYAEKIGALYMETSAKTGKGIEELFMELTKRIVERKLIKIPDPVPQPDDSRNGSSQQDTGVIRLNDAGTTTTEEKKKCKC